MPRSKPSWTLRALLVVAACAFYVAFIVRRSFLVDGERFYSLFDDAMISMRYARNLAEGAGLVWNAGEPAVEGYTNFSWTLWMAAMHLLGLPESKVSLAVMLSSIVCLVGNAFVVEKIAEDISGGNPLVMLGSFVLTLFSYPLLFWSLFGMEVGLLSLCVDAGILCSFLLVERFSWRRLGALCLALTASVLTRPDAIVPIALLVAFVIWTAQPMARVRAGVALVGTLAVVSLGHTLFRKGYYHDALPNTYYLKVAGTPLLVRLMVGLPAFLKTLVLELWPLVLVPLAVLARFPAALASQKKRLLLLLVLGQCAYSIYVGGDAWEQLHVANRYLSVALPAGYVLMCLLLAEFVAAESKQRLIFLCRALAVGAGSVAAVVIVLHYAAPLAFALWGRWFLVYSLIDLVLLVGAAGVVLAVARRLTGLSASNMAALAVVMFACLDAPAFAWWAVRGTDRTDEEMTRLGLAIEKVTRPAARIGVVWAGAPPYFSHRPSLDLLGKTDRVVAKQPSHLPFLPGHTKWDYRYSISTFHPDLILQTWRLNGADRAFLAQAGYERLPNGMFVLRDSPEVDSSRAAAIPIMMRHPFEEL